MQMIKLWKIGELFSLSCWNTYPSL